MVEKITDTSAGCDLCGQKPRNGQLHITDKHLCVCADCRRKLEEMPAKARDNLENYLIGNII